MNEQELQESLASIARAINPSIPHNLERYIVNITFRPGLVKAYAVPIYDDIRTPKQGVEDAVILDVTPEVAQESA